MKCGPTHYAGCACHETRRERDRLATGRAAARHVLLCLGERYVDTARAAFKADKFAEADTWLRAWDYVEWLLEASMQDEQDAALELQCDSIPRGQA